MMTLSRTRKIYALLTLSILCILVGSCVIARDGKSRYRSLLSVTISDRNGVPMIIEENVKGLYGYPSNAVPTEFKELLLKKEDRFFYYHLGINPFSTLGGLFQYMTHGDAGGVSTITQQLAKNILRTESDRTLLNKCIEGLYAVSLELFTSKDELLLMYANTVFLGNQIQGFETASRAYFNKSLKDTSVNEQLSLLATLSHPSSRNPWKEENTAYAEALHKRLSVNDRYLPPIVSRSYTFQQPSAFELRTSGIACDTSCTTTLDTSLNEAVRSMLAMRIEAERDRGARNGAVVIIDARTSELLALVGSPDPAKAVEGGQINMALEPRPIGSTVKPFIYLKGFMQGLRPYSLVDDREYKYPIATGFSLYPKNFDGTYHGVLTLHEALSNSLNVPSVKVLEYIGLPTFYQFMNDSLHFKPIQPYDSYQYGIALGGLEMDLLTLTHYFTLFPRYGTIAPLKTLLSTAATQPALPPQSRIVKSETVSPPEFVELVHAILSDRLTGVGQFGLKSNLNLTIPFYAVKTGTSRDFHDSWVVGYTPEYVVGVWLGNSENEALEQVTGQSGAGTVWHDVMEYMAKTDYYKGAPFTQDSALKIPMGLSEEWGLPYDKREEHESLLIDNDLVISPHPNDTFELTSQTTIPLYARTEVVWSANGVTIGNDAEVRFTPKETGSYEIRATDLVSGESEYLQIIVTDPQ